jgi:sugar phosphate isomerase/epimerase
MAKLQLGINTCFAVKRWPEASEWAEIVGSRLDLDIAQFSFDLVDPRVRESVRTRKSLEAKEAAKQYGVKIHSTFTGLGAYSFNLLMHPDIGMRSDALDWYEQAVHMTSDMGAGGTGGHVASMSLADYRDETRSAYFQESLIESLQHLSRIAADLGQEFVLWEPMPVPREPPCNIADAKSLHARVNDGAAVPVDFCLDTGHQCAYSEDDLDLDTFQWVKEVGALSPVMHVQQTDGAKDRHWPFTPEFEEDGIIDAGKLIQAIDDSGAGGVALVLEIIHAFEEKEDKVMEDLEKSVAYWKEYV